MSYVPPDDWARSVVGSLVRVVHSVGKDNAISTTLKIHPNDFIIVGRCYVGRDRRKSNDAARGDALPILGTGYLDIRTVGKRANADF